MKNTTGADIRPVEEGQIPLGARIMAVADAFEAMVYGGRTGACFVRICRARDKE
jgi:hypothetical protein